MLNVWPLVRKTLKINHRKICANICEPRMCTDICAPKGAHKCARNLRAKVLHNKNSFNIPFLWKMEATGKKKSPEKHLRQILRKTPAPSILEDRNLLKLRSLDSSGPFCLGDTSIWGNKPSNDPNAIIARLKSANAAIAKGRNRGKTPNAIVA